MGNSVWQKSVTSVGVRELIFVPYVMGTKYSMVRLVQNVMAEVLSNAMPAVGKELSTKQLLSNILLNEKENDAMKKIIVRSIKEEKLLIPAGHFASDWFKCSNCGFEERKRIGSWQNTSTCTRCGGTAYRQ